MSHQIIRIIEIPHGSDDLPILLCKIFSCYFSDSRITSCDKDGLFH